MRCRRSADPVGSNALCLVPAGHRLRPTSRAYAALCLGSRPAPAIIEAVRTPARARPHRICCARLTSALGGTPRHRRRTSTVSPGARTGRDPSPATDHLLTSRSGRLAAPCADRHQARAASALRRAAREGGGYGSTPVASESRSSAAHHPNQRVLRRANACRCRASGCLGGRTFMIEAGCHAAHVPSEFRRCWQ
jgi:hypothetical protein